MLSGHKWWFVLKLSFTVLLTQVCKVIRQDVQSLAICSACSTTCPGSEMISWPHWHGRLILISVPEAVPKHLPNFCRSGIARMFYIIYLILLNCLFKSKIYFQRKHSSLNHKHKKELSRPDREDKYNTVLSTFTEGNPKGIFFKRITSHHGSIWKPAVLQYP